jgi:extracellular factor (EF) 3-hydroxypalmitic acid methyl ester biosynthesis protein
MRVELEVKDSSGLASLDESSNVSIRIPSSDTGGSSRPSAYEEREGGAGANIYFRAQRFPTRDLLERVPATLFVRGNPFEVHDISMNGVAFFAIGAIPDIRPGDRFPIRLSIAESTVYDGEGEVVRVDQQRNRRLVGLRLTVGFLDIPGIVATHDELVLARDLERGAGSNTALVDADYRCLCADMVYLLRHYRAVVEGFEKHLRSSTGDRRGRYESMLEQCYAKLRAEWEPLRLRANELVRRLGPNSAAFLPTKRFTEAVVTRELMGAPSWHRSYTKPLGYPGDYVIMNYFYAGAWEGNSAFEKVVHRLLTQDPLPACVIPRMEMLRDAVSDTERRVGAEKRPARITSLGSGPAREVEEYLRGCNPAYPVHFLLIDQDERALSYAHSNSYPLASRFGDRVTLECLYLSFSQLVRNSDMLRLPPQDLIYAAGLVDYLSQPVAKVLLKVLRKSLAPGGTLVVGNMKARDDVAWTNEFVLDWPLIFRTEEEMLDLAAELDPANVEVRLDRTGCTYLLYVRAP